MSTSPAKSQRRLLRLPDFQAFADSQVTAAFALLVATVAAVIMANSPWREAWDAFWHTHLAISAGPWKFDQSLLHWIDDGLMGLFFLVVGLEIKREFLVGELSSARKAALPVLAAVGGMIVPALIYLAIVVPMGGDARGWGVPMATDIAFALGVLALLGSRIPTGLKVFLTALAIADDIGAVLVIAFFYSSGVTVAWLGVVAALMLVLIAMNRLRVQDTLPYLVVGTLVWFAMFFSGVHATIAGILVAFTIPATSRIEPMAFVGFVRDKVERIEEVDVPGAHVLEDETQQEYAREIARAADQMQAPLQRLEHQLEPFVSFIVLPVFALANAGVTLVGVPLDQVLVAPVELGVLFGLLIGKPVGVVLATWIGVRTRLGDLPEGTTWLHVIGAGMLAGIGFTMALFVSALAFARDPLALTEARVGIFAASILAGVIGYAFMRFVALRNTAKPAEEVAS
jgi:NhaA family Na+:H+ antiporter